jgi:DNA (cytosine-5)-methyltransferase 1
LKKKKKADNEPLLPFGDSSKTRTAHDEQKTAKKPLNVVGLFAGVGGVELGLKNAGHHCVLLCEIEEAAQAVLKDRFPKVQLHGDVKTLSSLPNNVDMITGGFPCQDLSQAGKGAGILKGTRSSLVGEIFRLVQTSNAPYVLLENVSFMLKLDSGKAMDVLASAFEELGYKWAYRVVNSLAFGVPQRRERVIFLACRNDDPRSVLFADEVDEPQTEIDLVGKVPCGFYWTEGIRGLGWAVNAVPTLKGGSTIGIPSPPAIVFPTGFVGTPDIRDAERMQGFPADWTEPACEVAKPSVRWKLIGNAVTVDLFKWVGDRLRRPNLRGTRVEGWPMNKKGGWPRAGWNVGSGRYGSAISSYPVLTERPDLTTWLRHSPKPLSLRAVTGFLERTERSSLRFPPNFIKFLRRHQQHIESGNEIHYNSQNSHSSTASSKENAV